MYFVDENPWLSFFCVVVAFVAFVGAIMLPITHLSINAEIVEFEATRATIATARERGNEIETAAMVHKMVEANQWLAGIQYSNKTIFGLWVPNGVENLKPIE